MQNKKLQTKILILVAFLCDIRRTVDPTDKWTLPMHGQLRACARGTVDPTQQNTIDPCLGGVLSGRPHHIMG